MNRHLQRALAFLLAAVLPFTLAPCNPASQGTVPAASGEQPTASVTPLEPVSLVSAGAAVNASLVQSSSGQSMDWLRNGMSMGAAAAFMITGPATKITNLGAVKIVLGIRRFLLYLSFVMLFSLLAGLLTNLTL